MKPATLALALAALLLPLAGWAQQRAPAPQFRAEPHYQPMSAGAKSVAAKRRATKATPIVLPMPAGAEKELEVESSPHISQRAGAQTGPRLIGFPRPVAPLDTESRLHSKLDWKPLPDGARVAAVSIASPGAAAMRIGIYVSALPPAAKLRFASAFGGEVHEFTGEQVLDTIATNLEAGGTGAEARTYWSPVIDASTAVMEVELPAGVPAEHLRMGVPVISHLAGAAANGFAAAKSETGCHVDVSCHRAWGGESNAVARLVFTVQGASYACTGTLLADQDASTSIPYFHTAQHCIPDQATASTVVTYWFYRSAACNSGQRARFEVRTGGALLLHTDRESDVAFLRLNSPPPAGALYAGWIAGAPLVTGTEVTGIHHPTGELQKISFGQIDSYVSCLSPTGENLLCSHSIVPDARYYGVSWRSGVTEAGSSGSGLFLDEGRYLIGQLFGGASSCESKSRGDYYARFDVAYRSALAKWLGSSASVAESQTAPPPLRLRMTFSLSARPMVR